MELLPELGRHAERQRVEVSLIRGAAIKARVGTPAIVKGEVSADRGRGVGYGVVGAQIDPLIFDTAPQPLDEHVVAPGAPAVHADGDVMTGEHPGERGARDCEPWSVLKMLGLPGRARASATVSTQDAASIVVETRHDSTRRLNQSSTTAR